MLKICDSPAQSQAQPVCKSNTGEKISGFGPIDPNLPLPEFFAAAVQQNEAYYASRRGKERFTSPLFWLVRSLKAHPTLASCSADEAFARLNSELNPDWKKLFPAVPLVDLEFVTAWEQANIPAGASALLIAGQHAIDHPLTLLSARICEGYDKYLAIAYHLQRLMPRRDILLPVAEMSSLLSDLLGKSLSKQSMSNYCRLAQKGGYLTLTARSHHPSGKAAQYRFDLKRFTESGVELDPTGAETHSHCTHGTHGNQGSHGIHGSQGIQGTQASSSSCVLKHAENEVQEKSTNEQEEKTKAGEQMIGEIKQPVGEKTTVAGVLHVKPKGQSKEKTRITKPRSVVSVWQSAMHALVGWQSKLPNEYYTMLVKFGHRTDSLGPIILTWVLNNWETFASTAVGQGQEYPQTPDIEFFYAYEAWAYNLWKNAERDLKQQAELEEALERLTIDCTELEWRYTLGEEALFENVKEQLKYKGMLAKTPKGYTIAGITEACGWCQGPDKKCGACGGQGTVLKTFLYLSDIHDLYYKDKEFSRALRTAAGLTEVDSVNAD